MLPNLIFYNYCMLIQCLMYGAKQQFKRVFCHVFKTLFFVAVFNAPVINRCNLIVF